MFAASVLCAAMVASSIVGFTGEHQDRVTDSSSQSAQRNHYLIRSDGSPKPTLRLRDRRVLRGAAVVVTGKASSRTVPVQIQRREGSTWVPVLTTRPKRSKRFKVRVIASEKGRTRYRAAQQLESKTPTTSRSVVLTTRSSGIIKKARKGTVEVPPTRVIGVTGDPAKNRVLKLSQGSSSIRVGQIVVVNVSSKTPTGVLGRVIRRKQGKRGAELTLRPATLADAYSKYHVAFDSAQRRPRVRAQSGLQMNCSGSVGIQPINLDMSMWGNPVPDGWVNLGDRSAKVAVSADAYAKWTAIVQASGSCGLELESEDLPIGATPLTVSVHGGVATGITTQAPWQYSGEVIKGRWTAGVQIGGDQGGIIKEWAPQPLAPATFERSSDPSASVNFDVNVGMTLEVAGLAGLGGESGLNVPLTLDDQDTQLCVNADVNLTTNFYATVGKKIGPFGFEWKPSIANGKYHLFGPYQISCFPVSTKPKTPNPPTPTPSPSAPNGDVGNDLEGPGVDLANEVVTGGDGQVDKISGLVPNQSTWVLSTGKVADAVGAPDFFASTDMNQPGSPALDSLSGYNTYDAATYTVTAIPKFDQLNVQYVFASEEYLEYVGSQFNDVMAVTVDGKQCSFVPGSATPVSVNTVNDVTNSASFIDNALGAAGLQTTMDGVTVPLTCSVPVTPGVPVTVAISVADGSDHVYDSAVALVDKGISSS